MKCTNCWKYFKLEDKYDPKDLLCRCVLKENDTYDTKVRCSGIVCKECKICWKCDERTKKFIKMIE